jgi:glucose/arabinose dehydrogenase
MPTSRLAFRLAVAAACAGLVIALAHDLPAGTEKDKEKGKAAAHKDAALGRAPESLPHVPWPDAAAAEVPPGYRVEVVLADLTYPTSVAFDDAGTMYVAEAGFNYGDEVAVARVVRVPPNGGEKAMVAEGLNGPVTDLLWHAGRLYISHRGKISALENGKVRDLVTGLPSLGDHHNNQMAVGPDGKIYFGQGTATNSGVVGLDSVKMGWAQKYPDVHDVPAKDIRVTSQAFETPDYLTLLRGEPLSGEGHGGHVAKGAGNNHGSGHEGHEKAKAPAEKKKAADGPAKGKEPPKGEGHEGHDPKAKDQKKGGSHEGHDPKPKDLKKTAGHEGHGAAGHGPNPGEGHNGHHTVKTFAFQPFGKTPPDDGAIRGKVKANGTILRMDPDGSNLEVYAWGLRNPFGLAWGPDKQLYASDNGYDERGSRPIAHAPDCVWAVKPGAWYGFPDYAGGVPVTDSRFQPEHGPAPKFLMRDHPPVEKPLLTLTHHVGAAKLAASRDGAFGFEGQLFLALSGDMNPITGIHEERSGFEVVRIDPQAGKTSPFFKARKGALGPKGMEYVLTAGPRRPVGVHFAPDGGSLYVVDVGAEAIISTATGPVPRPFPGTGVIWRIMRSGATPK